VISNKSNELVLVVGIEIAQLRNMFVAALAAKLAEGAPDGKVHAELSKPCGAVLLINVGGAEATWWRPVGPLEESLLLEALDLVLG
jgi:hypothetical protein